ncbi:MAG: hypothetical protein IJZ39_10095 [Oscillospiraceae bacterium]|nr:hypothetical protein [Oscillospiraceae bacterium]
MKKILVIALAAVMVFALFGCQAEEEQSGTEVVRTFIAGYEDESAGLSARVLVNLMGDGAAQIFVGTLENGVHSTEQYDGTYTLGENDEFDETISLTYPHGEITDAVIIDGIFEMPFYLAGSMSVGAINFYESAPAAMDGDVYVGYLTKTGGMGAMVYAYALCLREDMTFDVSIMQMASVMHVWGGTGGTYTVDGENITFTYDILSTEGEIVAEDDVTAGTGYTDTTLSVGFNISQATMRASASPFIRVK